MSKYYKAEDVINTLADQWRFEQVMEYPDTAEDIEEWKKVARELYADLPTIEVVRCEGCVWRDKDNQGEGYCTYAKGLADIGEESFCSWGNRIEK